MLEVTQADQMRRKRIQQRFLTEGISHGAVLDEELAVHRTEALAAAQAEIAELRAALGVAVRHIEHQAKWIGAKNGGYSFEALGEDMPAIRQALGAKP